MATVIRVATVILISIAVSIDESIHGCITCDTCECPLSNVKIINDIKNQCHGIIEVHMNGEKDQSMVHALELVTFGCYQYRHTESELLDNFG